MTNEEPLMDDEQAGDAVAKYLEDNPELLQGIVPEHDLWPAIESRISARVIPMSVRQPRAAHRSFRWVPMLIAASALVAASAGITYVLTSRSAVTGNTSGSIAATSPITTTDTHTTTPVTQSGTGAGTGAVAVAHNEIGRASCRETV